MVKRWRWLLALLGILTIFGFVAECGRRPTVEEVYGPPMPPPASAVAVPSKAPRTGLAKKIDDWNLSAPSEEFPKARISRDDDDEAPTAVASEGRFFVSLEGGSYTSATPAVYDGVLLVGGRAGSQALRFYGLDAKTGEEKWVVDVQDSDAFSPACDEGVCAFTTGSCSLYVVDAKTGQPKWGRYLAGMLESAPAISRGKVFAAYPKLSRTLPPPKTAADISRYMKRMAEIPHAVVGAFDVATGTPVWQRWTTNDAMVSLEVRGDAVVADDPLSEARVDVRSGDLLSARSENHLGYAAPLDQGRSVVRTYGSIDVIDPTGNAIWKKELTSPTDPIVAGGSILVGTAGGDLLRIDPANGNVIGSWRVGSSVIAEPIVDDGWIYASTADGVVGIDTGDRTLTGWSQWGGNAQRSKAVISRWSTRYFYFGPMPSPTPVSTIAEAVDTPPELQYLAPDPSQTPP